MRTFHLVRREDVHGISGTGAVAQGVLFDTGKVAMAWLSGCPSVTVYDSLRDVVTIHGHGAHSTVVFDDGAPAPEAPGLRVSLAERLAARGGRG